MLLASLVVVGMGFTVLFPVLAPLGREIGLSEIQITSIIAMSSITVFLASPRWGRLSDRAGRKKIMLLGVFGFAAGTVLFNSTLYLGLAGILTGTWVYVALIGTRMTHAAIMSATMPAANAYMADITTPANRTRGMGAAGAANNIGAILGPAVAILSFVSLLTPLWVMALASLLNGIFIWRFLPESPRARTTTLPPKLKYTDHRILPFIIVGVAMFTGNALVQQTMGFRFQDALDLNAADTAQAMGIAMMGSAAASLFAQAFVVQRLEIPPFKLLTIALPVLVVAFVIMAVAEARWILTAALAVQGFGMGLAGPGFMAGASLSVSPQEQGSVAGVAGSCGPLGFTIGPLMGGALYQFSETAPYTVAACMYVVLIAFMPYLGKRVAVHRHEG
ncbi:MAG: MFS transporter [Pseudomonadales bacterium]|nr:MFS transporter [Pseudomonadales bacterium]MCP5183293.1 MFS transporter [Pseudomonadales bacterium]